MDYEKKHKEEVARATQLWECGDITRENLEYIFPELSESEDEKVRKALAEMVHDTTGDELWVDYNVHKEEALAWLGKQYEKKVSYTTLMETGNGGINALVTKELPTDGCDDEQKHYIDIDKMVDDYANNKERGNEEFGKPVPCMIRAYRQGLNDAIEKVVRNPAWSEEDNKWIESLIQTFKDGYFEGFNQLKSYGVIDWLKSLKQRIGG